MRGINSGLHSCLNNGQRNLTTMPQNITNSITYSAKCRLVLDCSALNELAMQKTSPIAGMAVSRYNCEDWVKYACNQTSVGNNVFNEIRQKHIHLHLLNLLNNFCFFHVRKLSSQLMLLGCQFVPVIMHEGALEVFPHQ